MDVLRTPDDRFAGLADFAFAPHYREVAAADGTRLRLHFLDEGPRDAAPVLLLHGNPTWCYLYRHMVPGLVARGHRVLAPDLMGLGRSDKPVDQDEYTLAAHADWLGQWLVGEDLARITLFCQDWGGTLGLALLPVHGGPLRPGRGLEHRAARGPGREQVPRAVAGLQPVGRRAAGRGARAGRHHP